MADSTAKANVVQYLENCEKRWITDLGAWFPGSRAVFGGKDIFNELGHLSWMGMWVYGVTRKIPSPEQVRLFDGMWVLCANYPEPRLWNNRIATLAGTARSTSALGTAAGIAVSEALIYGNQPVYASAQFFCAVRKRCERGETLEDILDDHMKMPSPGNPGSGKYRTVAKIPGFGRPVTDADERVKPLLKRVEETGFSGGYYLGLITRIETALLKKNNKLHMNIAGLISALCLDQGMTPRQVYHFMVLCFSGGILPCAIDAQEKPEGTFFPLRCSRIKYQGPARRPW